jgi:hypothetical protein
MFDDIFNRTDKSTHVHFPENINVHEHKAPTDESVRLLNEMQEKAVKNIIAAIRVEDNTVNGVAIAYQDLAMIQCRSGVMIYLKFKVNGVEHTFEETVEDRIFADYKNENKLTEFLRDRLKARVILSIFDHLKVKIMEAINNKNYRTVEEKLSHKI